MSVLYWFLAIFCSPLYFILRGHLVTGILIHAPIYFTACVLLVVGIGVFFWFPLAMHAMWDLSQELQQRAIDRSAQAHAKAIASELRSSQ